MSRRNFLHASRRGELSFLMRQWLCFGTRSLDVETIKFVLNKAYTTPNSYMEDKNKPRYFLHKYWFKNGIRYEKNIKFTSYRQPYQTEINKPMQNQ